MKSLNKIGVIALLVISGSFVMGQASDDVVVTATCQTAIGLSGNVSLAVGNVEVSTAVTIDPTSNASHSGLLDSPTIGRLTVDGFNGATVVLTFGNATLAMATDVNPTAFTTTCSQGASAPGASTISSGGTFSMTQATHELYFGGSFTAGAAGSYSTANSASPNPIDVIVDYQ